MTKMSRRKGQKARIEGILSKEEAQKLGEILTQFTRDCQFIDSKIEELTNQYPDRWVVVYHEEVIGTGKNFRNLMWRLRRKGIDTSQVATRFLNTEPRPLILLREAV